MTTCKQQQPGSLRYRVPAAERGDLCRARSPNPAFSCPSGKNGGRRAGKRRPFDSAQGRPARPTERPHGHNAITLSSCAATDCRQDCGSRERPGLTRGEVSAWRLHGDMITRLSHNLPDAQPKPLTLWYNEQVPEVGIGSRAPFLSSAERLVLHDSDRQNQKRRHRGPHRPR
jgi:hypothetical protein